MEATMDRRDFFQLSLGTAAAGLASSAPAHPAPSRTIDHGHVAVDQRTRLFVRDWGEGPTVLFLAGWTLSSDFWRYQMLALKTHGFRVLAYDRRGHGRSGDPGGGYDFDTLSDDLASVIKDRNLNGVTLVAHSMAAGEVARYFTRHRGRGVRKLVLVGPTTPYLKKSADNPLGVDRSVMAASRAAVALDFPGQIDAQIGPFFTSQTARGTVEWVKQMMLETSMQAVIELAEALQETDFRSDLPRINVPTLVVHGDKDVSAPLPLTGKRTAELIPYARLSVVEGGPHGLPVTHVERLNRELLTFVGA
jgi:pimeloyl-ACP methyl ester carboxylesterase